MSQRRYHCLFECTDVHRRNIGWCQGTLDKQHGIRAIVDDVEVLVVITHEDVGGDAAARDDAGVAVIESVDPVILLLHLVGNTDTQRSNRLLLTD